MSGVWAALVIVDIAVTYVCFMKGKKLMAWIGVVGVIPPLTFGLVLVPVIGAMTPANPGSKWDRSPLRLPPPPNDAWRYAPNDSTVTRDQQASTPAERSAVDTYMEDARPPTPVAKDSASSPGQANDSLHSTRSVEIRAFLKQAVAESIIDGPTYVALVRHLEEGQERSQQVAPVPPTSTTPQSTPAAAIPPHPPVIPPVATPEPPPPVHAPEPPPVSPPVPARKPTPARQPAPVHTAPAQAAAAPAPVVASKPAEPREPSQFAKRREEMWAAFTSDVAVHGLVYLGVLLTFVSVLGFMLFAFKDLPISAKPFVELLIVLTFFGWAWVLHHQNATRVAKAMELLGGMILPLVWYAALVDSAGVPPDVEGDALVLSLVVSSLVLSGIYWLISRRFENSMLRFLVWPMVWTAAMGIGFAFKTDEHLVGDAITRLVAPQPALASVAIAGSLAYLMWHSDARLAKPTYMAALVGIPSAYLLTFGLSLGDGVAVSWPIIVSGAGTVAGIELVAHWYEWQAKLRPLRPYVYALVGVPLVLAIGIGWGGAIIAISYVVLAEIAIRSPKLRLHDVMSAQAGAIVGLVLSLAEPGAAVVAFGTVSIWAHIRRRTTIDDVSVAQSLAAVAALAPLGLLFGVSELTTVPTAILIVTIVILAGALILRIRNDADDFDSVWFPVSASALGAGAALYWTTDGSSTIAIVASLGLSAAVVALGERWPTVNLWLSAALASLAVAISLEMLDATEATIALVWSSIGIGVIVSSMATAGAAKPRVAPGNLAILGHLVGLFAFMASTESLGFTIAITGWAVGWTLSFAASERRGGVNPLELWVTSDPIEQGPPITLEQQLDAVAPSALAVTAIAAVAAIFFEVTSTTDERAWLGVAVGVAGVAYAVATKWLIKTEHGRTVFGWSAGILAVAGIGLSYAEPLAIMAASLLVVVVRAVLHRVLTLTWLTWVTWLMPAVASSALAHELGLVDNSLGTVTLGVGVTMLLATLATDEVMNGPRVKGQLTRAKWMLPPVSIGAVLIPTSVAALYLSGSSASDWAASAAALALALASILLRRSIWLTATLSAISLAVGLHAAHAPVLESAIVWSALGLLLVLSAPVVRGPSRDDIAGIGHAVGAVGLAYAFEEAALVVALSAWAIGWLIGVTTSELGGPSISLVLERSSQWWDESYGAWTATVSRGFPPVMAVATSAAATLVVYDDLVTSADARMWIGAVVGGLGLGFAAVGAHLMKTKISSTVFGWGGLVLAAGAILLALPDPLPIAVTTTLFLITRVAVIRLIPDPWLNWVTWLMPTAAITAIASAMGIADASITIVPIITGGAMLMGALLADRSINGRRTMGDRIRSSWLIPPSILGAAFMLVGLALLRDAETNHQLWAGAGVALTYAAASLLLRRSIWLTSGLSAIGLALVLEAANASAVDAATAWAILGIATLVAVPFAKGLRQTHLATIGHLFGLGAFAYSTDPDAYLIALTAWTLGWLGSVAAAELGLPSFAGIFADSAPHPEDEHRPIANEVAAIVPSVLSVITSTALALSVYERFVDFSEPDAWTAIVLTSLGLVFAVSSRFVLRSKPASSVFAWSGVVLAGGGVIAAIGNDVPLVITASAFIVVRALVIGAIPQTWLSWPAWLMPTVIAVAAGHALGVPGQSVYLISLTSGAAMMIGSLVFDDMRNSRRSIGEGLRTPWLRYPFVIGLLVVPLSLAPVFALDTTTVGIASLAAAFGYLVVAVLLRAGAVSAPALGLAVFGTAVLLPTSAVDNPWILVAMAALIASWSFISERLQSAEAASNPWTRWDVPALSVAHLIAATAIVLTLDGSPDPATWVAAGALSMAVGIWRRNRWWVDAGLLLVIAGSGLAGEPWLFIALVVVAVRGMYGVSRDQGVARLVDHAIAATAFVAAWIDLAVWLEWTYAESVSYGSVAAGAVALVVAALSRTNLAKKDTFFLWTAIGLAGVLAGTIAGFNAVPTAVDGPWIAIGVALIAASSEQWARIIHRNVRFGTPVIAALAWVILLAGLDLSDVTSASATSVMFGLTLAVSTIIARHVVSDSVGDDERNIIDTTRVWAVVSLTGIAVSISMAVSLNATDLWWATTAGLLLTTFAVATGGRAVGIDRLRIGSGLPALGGIAAALTALDVSAFGIGISMIVGAATATLVTVWLVSKRSDSDWIETVLIAGIAATGIAVPIAAAELPATDLIVMILLAVGGQSIAYGIAFDRPSLVAFGPPALGLAAIMLVAESVSGSALWFTVPIAVVMLAEADILHQMTTGGRDDQRSVALLILEWSGVALLSLPPLVEMFTTSVFFGLLGFGFSVGLLMWALLTKVKRRVLAACVVATLSVMLTLAAAASSNVQESAAFWIIGGGIGFSIMLIAGFVEAYRSRSGALMTRLGDLMEDWE